MVHFGQINLVQ